LVLPVQIGVVVISRNEGANLRRTLDNLEETLPSNGRIVVIDDGSTDESVESIKPRRGRLRILRESGLGVTRARNLGARSVPGDVVVFADAHLKLEPDWWRPLVKQLEGARVGAVAPVITDVGAKHKLMGYGLTFRNPQLDVKWLTGKAGRAVEAPILPGCCLAMRRDVFVKTGGWDEGLLHRGNVDNEFSMRLWLLGYRLKVTPGTVVSHLFRPQSP
jgi:GT2 family glycosyltransferase